MLWLRQISYDGVSEKAELIEMVHELYEAAGSESSASEEEDHEGPHPLVEKVAATVAEVRHCHQLNKFELVICECSQAIRCFFL